MGATVHLNGGRWQHFGGIRRGTSDIPVAREAMITAEAMGKPVNLYSMSAWVGDIDYWPIENASVLIVVAGVEGALPSVVGGWLPYR